MTTWSLVLYALYLVLAFGARTAFHLHRTGTTGFRGFSQRPAERFAGILFLVALVGGLAAPILDSLDVLEPVTILARRWLHVVGVILYVIGLGTTLAAQWAMGDSWRIGVDATERTVLVTSGPFAIVRNPIFAAMIPTGLGLALLVPNILAFASWLALVVALELQVRWAEEPYLSHVHGDAYVKYSRRVGRFFPGVGRLRH